MKNLILLLTILFLSSSFLFSQVVPTWMYLRNNGDTLTISQTSQQITGGDTLFQYDVKYANSPTVISFYLKKSGDTTYLHEGTSDYFLYTFNNVQLGDVWQHPFYKYNSYINECDSTIDLVVVGLDSINVSGEWLESISLYQPNHGFYGIVVEKLGYWGYFGFFFNLTLPYYESAFCTPPETPVDFWNYPTYCFQHYNDSLHHYGNPTQCNLGIEKQDDHVFVPKILHNGNHIEVKWGDEPINLKLYNISGQMIVSSPENSVDLPSQQGIYFLHIQKRRELRIIKIAN